METTTSSTTMVTLWGSSSDSDDTYNNFWMPLLMSCIAGGSTCLGAAVVFCQPRGGKQQRDVPLVSEGQLSFSLSLAASVMITVSVISIGPECLSINTNHNVVNLSQQQELSDNNNVVTTWIPIWSMLFLHRLAAFALGCFLYVMLSWFAFPETDVILGFDQERQSIATTTTTSSTSSRSNSPLIWEEERACLTPSSSSPSGVAAVDSPDMEKGGGAIHTVVLIAPSPKSPKCKPQTRRYAAANTRQRRMSRKVNNTASHANDVKNVEKDDDNWSGELEPMMSTNYEKTDNPASLTAPSRWWWWSGSRMMQSNTCCCGSGGGVGTSSSSSSAALVLSSSTSSQSLLLESSLPTTSSTLVTPLLTIEQRRAWRVAMLLFVSLLCHNFPEGLAVAASALESHKLGMTVTIGIMIHNIPEGIAIAVPCLAARPHQPWLAFWLASLSGLAEPLGAWISLSVLRPLTNAAATAAAAASSSDQQSSGSATPNVFLADNWVVLAFCMENILAFVAGIMITVACMDLFPEAWRHSQQSKLYFISGTLAGITVMAATEWYLP